MADGVGGGPRGDLASAAFLRRLAGTYIGVRDSDGLRERLRLANWDIRAHASRDPALRGMATTFTGIVVTQDDGILLGHSGDSRAYRLRDGVVTQESHDDSFVQGLIDNGVLTLEAAASHFMRNVITASATGAEDDRFTIVRADAQPGDRWLFCSDGLTDYVEPGLVEAALGRGATPARAAEELVDLALASDARDNITAVVCDVVDGDADANDRAEFHGAAARLFAEELD